uniref:Uncharacterized protein n=1 Tax=Megaselia scalaris TaxID=36166 RepID=T1GRZ5_MEGSC
MNIIFSRSLSKVNDLKHWNCYSLKIENWTNLVKVSQGYFYIEKSKKSCKGESYGETWFATSLETFFLGVVHITRVTNVEICHSDPQSWKRLEWISHKNGVFGKKSSCPRNRKEND